MNPLEDIFSHLPDKVLNHLHEIINQAHAGDFEEGMTQIAEAWLTKKAQFDKIIDHGSFTKAEVFQADDPNGCMALTMSGSLVCIGPLQSDSRAVEYHSIGFRTDTPDHVSDSCILAADAGLDEPIIFSECRIERTSPVLDLALADRSLSAKQQLDAIKKASNELSMKFLEINQELQIKSYTNDNLRSRRDLFNKWIILDWFSIGGLGGLVFKARAFILWLELFSDMYKDYVQHYNDPEKLDSAMLDLMNPRFAGFCDVYKWLESEKKDFDIGLIRALEEIPQLSEYKDFLARNVPDS